ncbi:MAG TPA: SUMF1/EgtB/PvdO family nonheme iron enzyme [Gemmataceae bacterium]|nr:SUMF1/EgtB/PvdO family nonheme iron enzyme [Gemmataceae bacterium]
MQTSVALLSSLGQAALTAVSRSGLSDLVIEGDAALAAKTWALWGSATDEPTRRAEVEALARQTALESGQTAMVALKKLAPGQTAENLRAVGTYLLHVPAAIRQALRRPSDPTGQTLPAWLALRGPADLQTLLPPRTPWFAPGDRPPRIGGWELTELIEAGPFGETWQAIDPNNPNAPPAALKFCLNPALKGRLRGESVALLEPLLQPIDRPGVQRLRKVFLDVDPPCLQYDYVEAGDLAALLREWHGQPGGPVPDAVVAVIRQLAEALAPLHRMLPPLIHRQLRPACILVARSGDGLACTLTGLGVDTLLSPEQGATVYRSPEQLRGEPADPRDDIYALGVLWYQLLTGSLTTGRPGGSTWKRRLTERGMHTGLIDLLEACFEDDPTSRPGDAVVLASRLADLATPATPATRAAGLAHLLGPAVSRPTAPVAGTSPPTGRLRHGRGASLEDVLGGLEKREQELVKLLTNSIGLKLVLIQAGSFQMGSSPAETGRCEKEGPRHEVTLANPFYLGVYPVTQEQFERVMGNNPARFNAKASGSPEHPIENVNWEEAIEFCRRLSALPAEKDVGRVYRLPTEAEWEYACRAGTDTPFCYGPTLTAAQANFDANFPYGVGEKGNFLQRTTRVGSYPPNNFGLYDMHGNVWEWCQDWHDGDWYRRSPKRNPQGPAAGEFRVLRGGCWRSHAVTCRSAYRNGLGPKNRDRYTGFRVVADVAGKSS